ncbi:ATP-binding cassette domain-containing protein [Streptosporangium saharense]|uniref:ATP-binding cassette domain-containing protein n=1 Tax=Streptosporangium saharense TaxID=1706840 RepID=UPI001FE9F68B|nr:ATP-binding cassette domain-containing protein [Streptosporangium saharense]
MRDCTLSVPAGRVIALVGPNGAGKSTFPHLLAVHRMLSGPAELADGMAARMPVISDSGDGGVRVGVLRTPQGAILLRDTGASRAGYGHGRSRTA